MQYLVPIRFNSSVGEIASTVERFGPSLGKHLLGRRVDLQSKRCDIIPVSNPRDLNQQELYESIIAAIEKGEDVHQIILDVGGPHYAGVPVNRIVGSVIAAIAKLNSKYPKAHKLVMFPKKLHADDMNFELFEANVLKNDRVSCFFYTTKRWMVLDTPLPPLGPQQHSSAHSIKDYSMIEQRDCGARLSVILGNTVSSIVGTKRSSTTITMDTLRKKKSTRA
jgi:hypothetical protein